MKFKLHESDREALWEKGIPKRMHLAICRYVERGVPPGHFLQAIITNDLSGAVARGDEENQKLLANYVKWFYNNAPAGCWGSPEAMDNWIQKQGEAA